VGVSALSAGAYTTSLYVMVDIVKGSGVGMHPPFSAGWADFSVMMECTPKSGFCESSVYNVLVSVPSKRVLQGANVANHMPKFWPV
jgi:hypothetical protein